MLVLLLVLYFLPKAQSREAQVVRIVFVGLFLLLTLSARGQNWQYENILDDKREAGQMPHLQVDSTGALHMTYWDPFQDVLYYGHRPNGAGWRFEVINPDQPGGFVSALWLDSTQTPHVAYYRRLRDSLAPAYARRTGAGQWQNELVVDSTFGAYGLARTFGAGRPQPSIDLFIRGQEVYVAFFDARFNNCQLFTYGGIGYELHLARHSPQQDWWIQSFGDLPAYKSVQIDKYACEAQIKGARYGEYCRFLQWPDGRLSVAGVNKTNGEVFLLREKTPGDSADAWTYSILDSNYTLVGTKTGDARARYNFEGLDVAMTPDSLVHLTYAMSDHHGELNSFATNGNKINLLFYQRRATDSTLQVRKFLDGQPSAPADLPYRAFTDLAFSGTDTLIHTYNNLMDGRLRLAYSYDGGASWQFRTLRNTTTLRMRAPVVVRGDSAHLLFYDGDGDDLLHGQQKLDSLGQPWQFRPIRETEFSGESVAMQVVGKGAQRVVHCAFNDPNERELIYGNDSTGTWRFDTVQQEVDWTDLDLALAPDGRPYIAFSDPANGRTGMVYRLGQAWNVSFAELMQAATSLNLALHESNDTLYHHLSYYDALNSRLRYRRGSGGVWSTAEIVESNPRYNVGERNRMRLDAAGRPRLVYSRSFVSDGTSEEGGGRDTTWLRYARRQGPGQWQRHNTYRVDTLANVFDVTLALDSTGRAHLGAIIEPATFADSLVVYMRPEHAQSDSNWSVHKRQSAEAPAQRNPLFMGLDSLARPFYAYNFAGSPDEVRMASWGIERERAWRDFPVTNNLANGRIANSFGFQKQGRSFYILGRKTRPADPGLAMLRLADYTPLIDPVNRAAQAPEDATKSAPRLYPNPARHRLQIRRPEPWQQAPLVVTLRNPQGQVLARQRFPAGRAHAQLRLEAYPEGLYLVTLQAGAHRHTRRLLKTGPEF
jgi:hypothetical protein